MGVFGFLFWFLEVRNVRDIGTVVCVRVLLISDFGETMGIEITWPQTLPDDSEQATWIDTCFSYGVPPFQKFVTSDRLFGVLWGCNVIKQTEIGTMTDEL